MVFLTETQATCHQEARNELIGVFAYSRKAPIINFVMSDLPSCSLSLRMYSSFHTGRIFVKFNIGDFSLKSTKKIEISLQSDQKISRNFREKLSKVNWCPRLRILVKGVVVRWSGIRLSAYPMRYKYYANAPQCYVVDINFLSCYVYWITNSCLLLLLLLLLLHFTLK